MMNKGFLAVAFLALGTCNVAVAQEEFWDDFRLTWGLNTFVQFARVPRLTSDSAINKTWALFSNSCENNGKFNGYQYIIPGDFSAALLFDVNGVIAGVQAMFEKNLLTANKNNTVDYEKLSPMYQNFTVNSREYYILTAYFVDPSIICTTGRTPEDLTRNGTGSGLWFQDGPSPSNSLQAPYLRSNAIDEGWTENNCFPAMGAHNFYRVDQYDPTNCTVMRPTFGLYNKSGTLLGFGLIIPGFIENHRFENPPLAAIQAILGETPECTVAQSNSIGLTSMHVYFVDTPWFINCL